MHKTGFVLPPRLCTLERLYALLKAIEPDPRRLIARGRRKHHSPFDTPPPLLVGMVFARAAASAPEDSTCTQVPGLVAEGRKPGAHWSHVEPR
jgi:hypothetical protein